MKMLTTQIAGLLQRIATNHEEAIEDTARLLAQASVGDGRVVMAGLNELNGVVTNALEGAESFANTIRYSADLELGSMDRVWLFTRSSVNAEALEFARLLSKQNVTFAVVSSEKASEENELSELADVYISTGISKGLLPNDEGGRVVEPHLLASLFIYEAVKLSYDEMLMDL
ncbi:DUF2529 family protein [Sporosarcina gallistercoris]|uniref:DUF2529 family protein n=1 Tax=Sporosarcina gallistercoris TaxID=2762245 RepID=A0ABR8PLZ2_9BACL|nr:DUF2529 family protein [Sporosarcina gallistercoris]MBD7909192.1 DUF2529 family protein [Sporosarcina gallistercoris]